MREDDKYLDQIKLLQYEVKTYRQEVETLTALLRERDAQIRRMKENLALVAESHVQKILEAVK